MTAPAPSWLLLPGHMCDADMWRETRDVIGGAAVVADMAADDRIEAMARRALAAVDGPVVAVGFSMGGIVALRMHAIAAERFAGLVLVDSNPLPDLPERAAARLSQQAAVRGGRLREVVAEELKPNYLAKANRARTDILERIMAMAERLGADAFLRQSEAIRTRPDARPGLGAIACPTLVIGGDEDLLCPPAWQVEMAAAITGASLAILPGTGHFAPVESPGLFGQVLADWAGRHL